MPALRIFITKHVDELEPYADAEVTLDRKQYLIFAADLDVAAEEAFLEDAISMKAADEAETKKVTELIRRNVLATFNV